MGVCNSSMFCCTLLYVHSCIAIILMGKRDLVALLYLSSWCLVMVERLFLAVPRGCLRFVIVVFPDHTHLLFSKNAIAFWDLKRKGVNPSLTTKNTNNICKAVKEAGVSVSIRCFVDWLQSLKQFYINVSYNILVASLTLMALF